MNNNKKKKKNKNYNNNNENIIKKIDNKKNIDKKENNINKNKKRNKSFNNNINKMNDDEKQKFLSDKISILNTHDNENQRHKIYYKYSGEYVNHIKNDNNNDKQDYNTYKKNIDNNYNLTNYYLNEIEVLKLNDKYKFKD